MTCMSWPGLACRRVLSLRARQDPCSFIGHRHTCDDVASYLLATLPRSCVLRSSHTADNVVRQDDLACEQRPAIIRKGIELGLILARDWRVRLPLCVDDGAQSSSWPESPTADLKTWLSLSLCREFGLSQPDPGEAKRPLRYGVTNARTSTTEHRPMLASRYTRTAGLHDRNPARSQARKSDCQRSWPAAEYFDRTGTSLIISRGVASLGSLHAP